jgi:hypothetical protein
MGDGPNGRYHVCRLDVRKATVCVAVAESGRGGEVRQIGVFENRPELLCKLVARLGKGGRRPSFLLRSRSLRIWVAPFATGRGHSCMSWRPR